jgi:hypothetical protein
VARFTAIGIDAAALGLPMDSVPWSEQTEAQDIARLDVGFEWLPSPLAGEGLGERGLVGRGLGSAPLSPTPLPRGERGFWVLPCAWGPRPR